MVRCIDMWSPTPVDCGTPPLCRETCQWATVLPDGGIFFPTDGSYASGFTYHAYFTPTDMSTLWGDKELGIKLDLGPALETSWLQDLGNRTSLRTWPEMDEVATTNSAAAEVGRSTVTLKPNESLADRWYVVRLSPPFWLAPPLTHVAPDGSYVARFRVGSDPRVANVTFAGGAKKHRLYIAISEPVAAEVSPASIVQVGNAGGSVMCTDVEFVAGRALASLSFDCPTLTAFPETITIGAGLSSTTAVPLAPATIAKADLVLAGCGPDCESGSVR